MNNKALAFSTFRHTLAYIEKHVADAGLRYGLVHGGVPDDQRAELRRRFALPKDAPEALDVLLSSEVGGEGLDFQFCDLLVNYDLPWNPMRIEQRIGRIDRYGQQSESVAIVNLVTPGTVRGHLRTLPDAYRRVLSRGRRQRRNSRRDHSGDSQHRRQLHADSIPCSESSLS